MGRRRERRDRYPSFGFFVQRCRKSIEGMEMQRCSRAVCRAYVYISAFFLRSFLVVPFFLPGNTLILTPRIKEASRSAWLIGHNHASMPGIIADGREIPSPPIDEIWSPRSLASSEGRRERDKKEEERRILSEVVRSRRKRARISIDVLWENWK